MLLVTDENAGAGAPLDQPIIVNFYAVLGAAVPHFEAQGNAMPRQARRRRGRRASGKNKMQARIQAAAHAPDAIDGPLPTQNQQAGQVGGQVLGPPRALPSAEGPAGAWAKESPKQDSAHNAAAHPSASIRSACRRFLPEAGVGPAPGRRKFP